MIIACDFDGTISYAGYPRIGKIDMALVKKLIEARKHGHKVILRTCRCGDLLDAAVSYCKGLGLEFDAVNENVPEITSAFGTDCRKVVADIYLDDKAVLPGRFKKVFSVK